MEIWNLGDVQVEGATILKYILRKVQWRSKVGVSGAGEEPGWGSCVQGDEFVILLEGEKSSAQRNQGLLHVVRWH
jgi:hypothetical protein